MLYGRLSLALEAHSCTFSDHTVGFSSFFSPSFPSGNNLCPPSCQLVQPSPNLSLLPTAMPSEGKAGSSPHHSGSSRSQILLCSFSHSAVLTMHPPKADRPLRGKRPETCPHLPQSLSNPADAAKHHQGQRTTKLGETEEREAKVFIIKIK